MIPTMRTLMTLLEVAEPSSTVYQAAAKHLLAQIDLTEGELDYEAVLSLMGYDPDDKVDTQSRQFKTKLMRWAKASVQAAFAKIRPHFRGNVIRVYREIVGPADWRPDPTRHPGPYWSWDEDAAEAHNGSFTDGNIGWMLVADVQASQIDWETSLAANAHPAFGDQAEIYVPETTAIAIIDYHHSRPI